MVGQMSQVSQPSVLASWLRSFGSFDAAHGWAVNLVVVVALVAIGACFVSGRVRLLRIGVIAGAVLCVATWVFVQDLGFFGGVGTDPNSMIPMAIVFVAGYLAVVRVPVRAEGPVHSSARADAPTPDSADARGAGPPAISIGSARLTWCGCWPPSGRWGSSCWGRRRWPWPPPTPTPTPS